MLKSLVVLALAGTMSVPASAQSAQAAPAANQAQQAKPKMVKKRICEVGEDNPYSRLKTKTCKTVMVPSEPPANNNEQIPAQAPQPGN